MSTVNDEEASPKKTFMVASLRFIIACFLAANYQEKDYTVYFE